MILTQQLTLGVEEAVNFTSAQRLSAVASMVYGGTDVVIIPKSGGLGDIYMNGQLQQKDANLDAFGKQMLQSIDANYRAQVAAAEAERAGKVFETDEAIRQQIAIDQNEAALQADQKAIDMALAIEQDLGTKLNDVQVEQLKAALVASGKLPGPAADYSYQKLGEDTIVVLSNGQQVAAFQLQKQDTAAGPQTVLVEIGG
jgi:nucleoside phosphorylase